MIPSASKSLQDMFTQIGLDSWSWKHIGKAFEALEAHELEPAEGRGGSGPLHIAPREVCMRSAEG